MPDSPLFRVQVSYSQVSNPCGLALKLNRIAWAHEREHQDKRHPLCRICQGLPAAPRGIPAVFGDAVHAGLEHELMAHEGPEAALEHARRVLRDELYEEWGPRKAGVEWDESPKIRRDGQPWKGSEKLMPTLIEAERNLEWLVPTWVDRFGQTIEAEGVEVALYVELKGAYEGCRVKCILDAPTLEGGVLDFKATDSQSWNNGDKIDGKLIQAHLCHLAYREWKGRPAEYMTFHLLKTGTSDIQLVDVPYDPAAIERTLEYSVYPVIRAIEADALIPSTNGWWHSEKSCDSWHVCPLGAAARGQSHRIELEVVAA